MKHRFKFNRGGVLRIRFAPGGIPKTPGHSPGDPQRPFWIPPGGGQQQKAPEKPGAPRKTILDSPRGGSKRSRAAPGKAPGTILDSLREGFRRAPETARETPESNLDSPRGGGQQQKPPAVPGGLTVSPGNHFGFAPGGLPESPDTARGTPGDQFGFTPGGSAAEAPRRPSASHGELNGNVRVLKL